MSASSVSPALPTDSDVVTNAGDVVPATLTANKGSRNRSIRKRKFTTDELAKSEAFKRPVVESDSEGPFWFEKSSCSYIDGEKVHHGITRREHQLLRELVKSGFFTPERLRDVVVPLNDETSTTPRLRAFDWAVTNFAKGRPQLHVVGSSIVDPNLDYQNELKRHHRLLFDPFRRGTHLFFEASRSSSSDLSGKEFTAASPKAADNKAQNKATDKEVHRTTVGQLCFIKWCIEHHVDRYVEAHLDEIRAHMSATTKKTGPQKRRRELTAAPKKILRGAVFDKMTIQ